MTTTELKQRIAECLDRELNHQVLNDLLRSCLTHIEEMEKRIEIAELPKSDEALLREQIRVCDVAYQSLHERHQQLQSQLRERTGRLLHHLAAAERAMLAADSTQTPKCRNEKLCSALHTSMVYLELAIRHAEHDQPKPKTKMRKLTSLLTLAAYLMLGRSSYAAGTNATIALVWDAPAPNLATNITAYYLYSTNDITQPVSSWPLVATFYPSNAVVYGSASNQLAYSITVTPGQAFYVLTASNFWGASGFSNVAATPPVLPPLTNRLGVVHYP